MKLNLSQKIALFWYKTIDVNGFLYITLKTLPLLPRILFYSLLIIGFYFSINLLLEILFLFLSKYEYLKSFIPKIDSIFNLIKYMSVILISMIISYESVYNENMKSLLEEKSKEKEYKKNNKKQWWRLRNKNIFFRFFFYLSIGFTLMQIIYIYYLDYTSKYFNIKLDEKNIRIYFNTLQEQTQFQNYFEEGLNSLMLFSFLIYITILIISEIYIFSQRKKHYDN